MLNLKLIGAIAGGLAIMGLVIGVLWAFHDYAGARAERAGYRECASVAAGKPGARLPSQACVAPIAASVVKARDLDACTLGLRPTTGGLWPAPPACPLAIATLAAEHNALSANIADRDQVIARLRADQSAAIARAAQRATQETRRQNDVSNALNRAPRGADGRLACDADCLRALAGEPASAGP